MQHRSRELGKEPVNHYCYHFECGVVAVVILTRQCMTGRYFRQERRIGYCMSHAKVMFGRFKTIPAMVVTAVKRRGV